MILGGIEAGGTKFVCGVGTGPNDLKTASFPTTTPAVTVQAVADFFAREASTGLASVGIGSFGPVDLDPASKTFGHITATPKLPWRNFDLKGAVERALGVPGRVDTDVNAAALGEARWGAGQGLTDFVYLTVGTGIGGGAVVNGQLVHGLLHPEMGHIRVPRDPEQDPYPGCCPSHGGCLEGLASGPAMEERWGRLPSELSSDHPAWQLEAQYLALGLVSIICTLSPKRILMGGGVMQQQQLFRLIHHQVGKLLNGYLRADVLLHHLDEYVFPPALGARAGVLGAMVLAERAQANPELSGA